MLMFCWRRIDISFFSTLECSSFFSFELVLSGPERFSLRVLHVKHNKTEVIAAVDKLQNRHERFVGLD